MTALSNSDLLDHLYEQLLFINSSCAAYDEGATHECKRLATHVRVLLHDTSASTSLLTHLDLKNQVGFFDGVPHHIVEAAHRSAGKGTFPGLAIIELTAGKAGFVPAFVAGPAGATSSPFEPWWTEPRMFDPQGNAVSRKQIVLWLANKDGGAHIDHLPPTYRDLSRNGSMGLTFGDGISEKTTVSPIPAAMRQIAQEVRASITSHIGAS